MSSGYQNPSVADFKVYFFRDFPYQPENETVDLDKYIQDADITKAFGQTQVNLNPALFADQANYALGYLWLSAHYLVVDLRASSQGLSGQFAFLETSKSVGSVSQGFTIPQRILDNPYWAMLMTTNYGAKYLQMIIPQLTGQVFNVYGHTLP